VRLKGGFMRRTSIRTAIIAGAVFTTGSLLSSIPAFAELIQGQITQVNQENKTVTVQPQDQQAFPKDLEIQVKDNVFEGNQQIRSIDELAIGDQITLEADKSLFGNRWSAQSILAVQNESVPADSAAAGEIAPPDDLTQDQGMGQEAGTMPINQDAGTIPQEQAAGAVGSTGELASDITGETIGEEQAAQGDISQSTVPPSESVVYGRVVSTDPTSNKIIVTDYASGQDREFTVVDAAALQSVRMGEEVMMQSDAVLPADGTDAMSAAGGAATVSIAGTGMGEVASNPATEGLATGQAGSLEQALTADMQSSAGSLAQDQASSAGAVVTGESFQESAANQPGIAESNASPLVSEPESANRMGASSPDQAGSGY